MIGRLIWRNLWRNRRRTFITMASVLFAVMLAIVFKSLQVGVFDNLVKNVVGLYSGYIQVHKQGYQDEQVIDNTLEVTDSLLNAVRSQPGVKRVVVRLESYALASGAETTKGCIVIGTDFREENLLTNLNAKVKKGTLPEADEDGALVGTELAQKLGIQVNDTLVILAQGYQGSSAAGKYVIKGFVSFGSTQLNRNVLYLPLHTAQRLFDCGNRATTLALGIDDPAETTRISMGLRKNLGKELEVVTWKEIMPEIENHIKADTASFYILTGILYMIIAFGIFGTVLMMMAERKFEMGMLLAIGMKRSKIGSMLFGETVLITLLATALGMALSLPVVLLMRTYPIRLWGNVAEIYTRFGFEPVLPTSLVGDIFITQGFIILTIALVIGLYPLLSVRKLDPVTSMKK